MLTRPSIYVLHQNDYYELKSLHTISNSKSRANSNIGTGNNCNEVDCSVKNACKIGSTCNATTSKCECLSGFEGMVCDVKSNSCLANPCKNSARCYDMLNDYECLDSLMVKRFGGKNAEIPLTGCNANSCINSGLKKQCFPFLDAGNKQQFSCQCEVGRDGGNECAVNTTYHISEATEYSYKIENVPSVNFSLGFRTTDADGFWFLLSFKDNPQFFLSVEVVSHGIRVSSTTDSKMVIDANTVTNNADLYWQYRFLLILYPSTATQSKNVICLFVRADGLPQGSFCDEYPSTDIKGTFYLGKPNIIKINPVLKARYEATRVIEACFVDLKVNGEMKSPLKDVEFDCFRKKSCLDNSCSKQQDRMNQCIEFWTSKLCVCKRPFDGEECENEQPIKTVSRSSGAYMQLDYVASFAATLADRINVSLFMTPRSQDGIIMYMGTFYSENSNINNFNNLVFLTAELVGGYLSVNTKISGSNTAQKMVLNKNLAWKMGDARTRFLSLELTRAGLLTVRLDNYDLNKTFVTFSDMDQRSFSNSISTTAIATLSEISIVFFGQPPVIVAAAVAQLQLDSASPQRLPSSVASQATAVVTTDSGPLPSAAFSSTNSVLAYFQDLQINSVLVGDGEATETKLGIKLQSSIRSGIVISPRECSNKTYCSNGGTCSMLFSGQPNCTCIGPFLKLAQCQYSDLCSSGAGNTVCPANTTCLGRIGGLDCATSFSIITTSAIRSGIVNKAAQFSRFSLRVRTRSAPATVVLVTSPSSTASMKIDVGGKLSVRHFNTANNVDLASSVTSTDPVNDAMYHSIIFTFSPYIELSVDNKLFRSADFGKSSIPTLSNANEIQIGDNVAFLGCVDRPMLNEYLVPSPGNSVNNSALGPLIAGSNSTSSVGKCVGRPVCSPPNPCQNGGTCQDNFNQYMCNCTSNYTGQNCEVPLCVALPACVNSVSGCMQICPNTSLPLCAGLPSGQPKYGCQCKSGWTGSLCDISDPCKNNVCGNNGICIPLVNETSKAVSFRCDCSGNWTGLTCNIPPPSPSVALAGSVIAGIVVAIIVFIIIIVVAVLAYRNYLYNKSAGTYEPQNEEAAIQNDFAVQNVLNKPNQEKLI